VFSAFADDFLMFAQTATTVVAKRPTVATPVTPPAAAPVSDVDYNSKMDFKNANSMITSLEIKRMEIRCFRMKLE
jgi:hypothetical protein